MTNNSKNDQKPKNHPRIREHWIHKHKGDIEVIDSARAYWKTYRFKLSLHLPGHTLRTVIRKNYSLEMCHTCLSNDRTWMSNFAPKKVDSLPKAEVLYAFKEWYTRNSDQLKIATEGFVTKVYAESEAEMNNALHDMPVSVLAHLFRYEGSFTEETKKIANLVVHKKVLRRPCDYKYFITFPTRHYKAHEKTLLLNQIVNLELKTTKNVMAKLRKYEDSWISQFGIYANSDKEALWFQLSVPNLVRKIYEIEVVYK